MNYRAEIVRFLGAKNEEGLSPLIDDAIRQTESLVPQSITAEFDIVRNENEVVLSNGLHLTGSLVKNSLSGCRKVLIIVATLTLQADNMLATAGSTVKEAVLNAALSAKIEEYVDFVEAELINGYKLKNLYTTPRFSPGYGDFPLSVQSELLSATNAEKLLGLHLTDSLMLIPVKSVTAIIGLSETPHDNKRHKCDKCDKQCIYRKL